MAISLISEPQDYTPAFNPVTYVVTGTNKGICDFQYIADVYVNGVFAIRLKEFPLGDDDYGYFDISRVLQDYLSHDYNPTLIGFDTCPNGIISYYVQFAERYGTASPCDGELQTDHYSYSASVKYAWNGALTRQQALEYNYLQYVANIETAGFLTAMPSGVRIRRDDYFNLDFLQDDNNPVEYIEIRTYNFAGVLMNTYAFNNSHQAGSPFINLKLSVGVGPTQLNDTTLSTGTQPIITDYVYSYTVQLFDVNSPGNAFSELFTFVIDERCIKYSDKPLWFWNRLGGFDRFVFTSKSTNNIEIERKNYSKPDALSYALADRGETTMSVQARDAYTFQSNWLTEDEGLWLAELFTSPEVILGNIEVVSFNITAVSRVGGFLALVIDGIPPRNQTYDYTLDGSAAATMGVATTGTITLTSFDGTFYITNLTAPNNSSALAEGTISYTRKNDTPLIITSTSYEEKIKNNVKTIQHTISARPAHKINIQNQ